MQFNFTLFQSILFFLILLLVFLIATRDYRIAILKCHIYETIARYGTREL